MLILNCNRAFDGFVFTSFISKHQTKKDEIHLSFDWETKKNSLLYVFWELSSTDLTAQLFALQRDGQVVKLEMKQVNSLVHSNSPNPFSSPGLWS